ALLGQDGLEFYLLRHADAVRCQPFHTADFQLGANEAGFKVTLQADRGDVAATFRDRAAPGTKSKR
ncbi:MAG: hypothetical protein AAFN50_14035, partial [Pseudomonadota bacterium]